tara:strand:- start:511 stop:906 length:396 start_codon:yes stop_codon:yes gene_type:complete
MDIHINDDAFIDLINDRVGDEIAGIDSAIDDLESELGDKATEDYVDDLAVDLRNEWTADIDTMREQIESNSPETQIDDDINGLELEIELLNQQVRYLDLVLTQMLAPGPIRRAYNRVLAMSSSINWYSPKL